MIIQKITAMDLLVSNFKSSWLLFTLLLPGTKETFGIADFCPNVDLATQSDY